MTKRVELEAFHPHELECFQFGVEGAHPHVLITAGIHGGEATGIWVARKLVEWLAGQEIKGAVTVLPVANPAAFRKLTRCSPYDELDLNRIFPGEPEGTPSMVLANLIWGHATQADYIVDLHCCGIFGSDYTLALWQEFAFARELAGKLDIPVVVQSGGTRNQLFVEACHLGIPAVIIELAGGQFGSGGGLLDRQSGERGFIAVSNMLIRLGVVAGEAPEVSPRFYGKLQEVRSLKAALWSPAVDPGTPITEGQTLGELDGEPVYSPASGVAISVRADSYVFPGHTVVSVAPVAEVE
ncbi:MAG: succinylglutamate desuccinylase/aspartoacylase family protein [Bacillota bacterium]